MRTATALIILLLPFFPTWAFKGECISGDCQNGEGVFQIKTGGLYRGTFRAGKANGKGKIESEDGTLEGIFRDDRLQKGIEFWKDGTRFEGEWNEKLQWSKGILTEPSGSRYEGIFKDGKFWEGKVKLVGLDGKVEYDGEWKYGHKYFQVPSFDYVARTLKFPEKWKDGTITGRARIGELIQSFTFNGPPLEGDFITASATAKTTLCCGVKLILLFEQKDSAAVDKLLQTADAVIDFTGLIVGDPSETDPGHYNGPVVVRVHTFKPGK